MSTNTTKYGFKKPELTDIIGTSIPEIADTIQKIEDTTIYYNVKAFGVVGDGIVDDSPAIQALVDQLMDTFPYAGTIYFPRGKYLIGTPINSYGNGHIDFFGAPYSSELWTIRGGAMTSIRFVGEGQESTYLISDNAEGIFKPYSSNKSDYFTINCEHLRFVGKDFTGTCAVIDNDDVKPLRIYFKNCSFNNFDVGYKYDRYSGTGNINGFAHFIDCNFTYNNNGIYIGSDNIMLQNCFIIHNNGYGMIVGQTHNCSVIGGKLEYNGGEIVGQDTQLFITAGVHALTFDTVYFEPTFGLEGAEGTYANVGRYLIRFDRSVQSTVSRAITFKGCYFNALYASFMQFDNLGLYGLTIDGCILKAMSLTASKELFNISTDTVLKNLTITGSTQYDGIYDSTGMVAVTDWIWTTRTIQTHNVAVANPVICMENKNNGGRIIQIVGSVASAGTKLFGNSYTVSRTALGIYRVELAKTNLGTDTDTTNMPVLVTVENNATPIMASVAHIDNNTFDVYLKKKVDDTAIDAIFSFMAMVSAT